MKFRIISILVTLILLLGIAVIPAQASLEEDIDSAINDGLEWLSNRQMPDGSWRFIDESSSSYDYGVTGLVLLKLVDRAKELELDPFDDNESSPTYYEYAANVTAGFNYIFNATALLPGDLVCINTYPQTYSTSIVMMALASTNAPDKVITVGALNGWTYEEALQGMVDWLTDAQNDEGYCAVGGWGYGSNEQTWGDQSNTGYATLALGYASAESPYGFGLDIPTVVLTNLSTYIDNIQDPVNGDVYDGGSWYEPCTPYAWINILKTGNLIYEMALVGYDVNDPCVQDAITYIENHWSDTGLPADTIPPASLGWMDCYQAMFTMMKGFESFGIETIDYGMGDTNWFQEVVSVILANQNPDGSWAHINTSIGEGMQSANLRAAWAMLTLERVVPTISRTVSVDIHPQSCPNPLNVDSKGILPVAILGTEEFDVTRVDPSSIILTLEGLDSGIGPLRWALEDVATPYADEEDGCYACTEEGPDGFVDLTIKFKMHEVVEVLELDEFNDRECVVLKLTGNLMEEFGSIPINGEDVVRIINKN